MCFPSRHATHYRVIAVSHNHNNYHIVPVNSCDYYNFQVEIGVATNRDIYIKIARQVKFMVFNLVLRGDYLRVETI